MKKLLFFIPVLTVFIASSFISNDQHDHDHDHENQGTIKTLKPEEFKKVLEQKKYILVDVRSAEEFATGHIKGAVNLDYFRSDFPKKMMEFVEEEAIMVYCQAGGRSERTANKLSQNGFTLVYDLKGGINAYKDAGLEIVK